MKNPSNIPEAISQAFALFGAIYGARWQPSDSSVGAWSLVLCELTPQEIVGASVAWAQSNSWPPSPADVRALVPRFCRCQKCSHCRRRIEERSRDALRNGAIGYDASRDSTLLGPEFARIVGQVRQLPETIE